MDADAWLISSPDPPMTALMHLFISWQQVQVIAAEGVFVFIVDVGGIGAPKLRGCGVIDDVVEIKVHVFQ
jgi:hypothetical protein